MKSLPYLLPVIVILLFACQEQIIIPERDFVLDQSKGELELSVDMIDAPVETISVEGKLYKRGREVVYFDFEIIDNSSTITVGDIASGDWILKIEAFDKNGNLIYSETIAVTVDPGSPISVSILLEPSNGSYFDTEAWVGNKRLVAHYPFTGNANDASGYMHHGIVRGATLCEDRFGNENNAYYFDGKYDEIFLEDHSDLDLTEEITICAWFKTETPQWGSLVSNFDQHVPDNGYELCIGSLYEDGGFVYFECAKDDVRDGLSTDASFHDGEWHFVVAIFAPDVSLRRRVFVDAIEQFGSNNPLGGPISSIGPTPDYPFKIGAASNKTGPEGRANFKGVIDEVRIYEGALNEAEIECLFNEGVVIAI